MRAAPKKCKKRGCPHMIRDCVHSPFCKTPDVDLSAIGNTQSVASKLYDGKRGSSAKRGYGGKWQRERLLWLADNPLCLFCELIGLVTSANVIDHIKPHKGDKKKFWKRSNWQPLCKHHHDKDKFKIETAWAKGLKPDEALIGIGVEISNPR
ncbi:MAG: HNH endonuclease [Hyphomicrobiales bacterium]